VRQSFTIGYFELPLFLTIFRFPWEFEIPRLNCICHFPIEFRIAGFNCKVLFTVLWYSYLLCMLYNWFSQFPLFISNFSIYTGFNILSLLSQSVLNERKLRFVNVVYKSAHFRNSYLISNQNSPDSFHTPFQTSKIIHDLVYQKLVFFYVSKQREKIIIT